MSCVPGMSFKKTTALLRAQSRACIALRSGSDEIAVAALHAEPLDVETPCIEPEIDHSELEGLGVRV